MNPTTKKENTDLTSLYDKIYNERMSTIVEQDDESTEGEKISKAANIKAEVDSMEERGEDVDPKLKRAATAAEDEINDTIKDLTTD